MSALLAIVNGFVVVVGSVVFIVVFAGALSLGYARFAEFGDRDSDS